MRLIIDGAALERLLRSPTGPVGVLLIEKAEQVKVAAQANIDRMTVRHTGCLHDSVVKRFGEDELGLVMTIQSDTAPCSETHTSYSYFVHEGTPPHNIPRAFGYPPPFGESGRFSGMFHPGTSPRPFLRDALSVLRG